jgi:hypothetical protein
MRNRKQNGQVIRIGERWYVRYWERRNIGGTVERKRVTQHLGSVTTCGKRPPADIEREAERHMATVNGGAVPAERIVTIGDFVERIYLPWIEQHKRPSTAKGYPGHLGRSFEAPMLAIVAQRHPHVSRSRLAKPDWLG